MGLRHLKYILFLIFLPGIYYPISGQTVIPAKQEKQSIVVERINNGILKVLSSGNYNESRILADSLERVISKASDLSSFDRANSLYYIGLSYSLFNMELKSFRYFNKAISILGKDTNNLLLGKIYYNIGYAYNRIDDDVNSAAYFLKSIPFTIRKKGEFSPDLVKDYTSVAISSINTRNYEKGIEYANKVLSIARACPDSVDWVSMADILQNKAVALINLSDHFQALRNLNQAYQLYCKHPHAVSNNYIVLLSNLATSYFFIGQPDDGYKIYEKALKEIVNYRSFDVFTLIYNYSLALAENGQCAKGEKLIAAGVEKIKMDYPGNPNLYIKALVKYADYLRNCRIDPGKAMELYKKCNSYIKDHPWSVELNNQVTIGYALSLLDLGKPLVALDSVSSVLNFGTSRSIKADIFKNPELSDLKPDKKTLDLLQTKFRILDRIACSSSDTVILLSRAKTAELLIDLIETMRIKLGEEQSRLILGDKYRNAYLDALRSYKVCYEKTLNQGFLRKVFEISERSKSASLLTSIREKHAMKAAIPPELMAEEREVEKEISFYESKYEEKKNTEKPDAAKLEFWEENLLSSLNRKDALLKSFEKNFPEYTSMKNSRIVVKPSDLLKVTGGKKEYLSYVIGDTSLYIFLVDRKGITLETVKTDSSFLRLINDYRRLMSEPDLSGDAGKEFRLFQEYGYRLYSYLIKPILSHLESDELIISTDNLLSYFPFEALVTDSTIRTDLYYSKLPYLMDKFRVSYVYSATLLSESGKAESSFRNSSVSFAPSYNKPILVDSMFVNRQQTLGSLPDLQYAREEAEYVAGLTSGRLFLNASATKSNYLSEAGKFDIIHLAMHTVINGKNPGSSGMIFSSADSLNGIYLKPYEAYGVMLKAKMVVLSSCFTGVGTLYAGEGVLSLARGFIFAGSNSVVMSLWEINDRSGTDIMKNFYSNLKLGKSKSEALREARIKYLKGADMLRAHPYFWSTLVIYGDDSPIYKPLSMKLERAALVLALILLVAGLIYFRKLLYSR